jgi:hypothetical protein
MIRLLPLALLALLLIPSAAQAACGVAPARAVYEAPSVQVYANQQKLIACFRATGKAVGVGEGFNDGMGTDGSYTVADVQGGRFLHVIFSASTAESSDVRQDSIVDLRSRHTATANVFDEETDNDVVVVRGAVVTAGDEGVIARFTGGRTEVLTRDSAGSVAASGARIYWRDEDAGATHTATLVLPAADPVRTLPRARTIGRCKPRPGARLVVRDANVVVTRAGGATWACRRGKTRRVGTGADASILSDREVAYTRPGVAGVLDIATGKRRELPSEPGPVAVSPWSVVAAAAGGVRAWTAGRSAAELLAPVVGREVAAGSDDDGETVAYWLDAGGVAQSAVTQ